MLQYSITNKQLPMTGLANLLLSGMILITTYGGPLSLRYYLLEMSKDLYYENFFRDKKILVTGASGFIGTNLINRLAQFSNSITGILHERRPQKSLLNVHYKYADLTKLEDCVTVCTGHDYVFMCAAYSTGALEIENSPLNHLTPNIVMNAQMLHAAHISKVQKFCFISSSVVYPDLAKEMCESDVDFTFYEKYYIVGWMKLFSEIMCEMYSTKVSSPMKTLVIRPSNLYGPYDKFDAPGSKVIPSLISRFSKNQNPIEVWGNGSDIKDFLYIDDFIEGLLEAFASSKLEGPINLVSGKQSTINDVLDYLCAINLPHRFQIDYQLERPQMIQSRYLSGSLAMQKIGWSAKETLVEGLRKTYDWYRKNSNRTST